MIHPAAAKFKSKGLKQIPKFCGYGGIFGKGVRPYDTPETTLDRTRAFSWIKRFDGIALFLFACGTFFLYGAGQQVALGIVMVLAAVLSTMTGLPDTLKKLRPIPPELISYTLWVGWAGITGMLVATSMEDYLRGIEIAVQMLAMVWAVYAILCYQKNLDVVYLAFIVGFIIQLGAVASGLTKPTPVLEVNERILGLTQNANSLGFRMVYGVICAMMFWNLTGLKKNLIRGAIFCFIPAAVYVILATGSRKSSLALLLVISFWTVFASSTAKGAKGYFFRGIFVIITLFIILQIIPFVMQQTVLGDRFDDFFDRGRSLADREVDVGEAVRHNPRYEMYRSGFRVFLEKPVAGVGINNFGQYYRTGQYSHSDYIEPLATTGGVGFLLYHAFYLFLLVRILRLLRLLEGPIDKYLTKMVGIALLTIMFIGLGTPHYTSQPTFILLTAISVFTSKLMQQVKNHREKVSSSGCNRLKVPWDTGWLIPGKRM